MFVVLTPRNFMFPSLSLAFSLTNPDNLLNNHGNSVLY
ncbi:hypothetical protein CWATWH8502_630 [Crocosphaera watsonii WH 8502]|uniref:Uncharacterized protein n=1 Tax=Crocosphaera watsonii WH 8502 TaxID=423474 RepID=T2IJ60_CROWT|nr:hypothetical protein CWATWH8502_630 [Crocosphaera watsonii WH 8502]